MELSLLQFAKVWEMVGSDMVLPWSERSKLLVIWMIRMKPVKEGNIVWLLEVAFCGLMSQLPNPEGVNET